MYQFLVLPFVYIISGLIPLIFNIGRNFEYEYALIASWTVLFLLPISSFFFPKNFFRSNGIIGSKVFQLFWVTLISPVFVLAIGFLAFQTNLCKCSYSGFWFWMGMIWYPAWVIAHGFFFISLRARIIGFNKRHVLVGISLLIIFACIYYFMQIWFNPQVRIAGMLIGFLHGPIYDRWIPVDEGLFFIRLSHLFAGFLLLFLSWFSKNKRSFAGVGISAALWFGFAIYASNFDSMKMGRENLEALLDQKITGNGYTIYYKTKKKSDEIPKSIKKIHYATQFHLEELTDILKEKKYPHVFLYVYPDSTSKKLWFGGGSTDVTDVQTPTVHITPGDWTHPTLRHELAHALTSGIAYHGLGFHPNMAFTEGFAVALAPRERSVTLDSGAASIIQSKKIKNVEDVFSPMFWKESGPRAYTVAGSFISYLIEQNKNKGIDKVKAIYSGKSMEDVFGSNKSSMIRKWKDHILSRYDEKKYKMYTDMLFRDSGLLSSKCPHSKEDLKRNRNENLFVRLRQPVGWNAKTDYMKWRLRLNPSNKYLKFLYWSKEISKVMDSNYTKDPRLERWVDVVKKNRVWPPESLEDIDLTMLLSDLYYALDKQDESLSLLENLEAYAKDSFLSSTYQRDFALKRILRESLSGEDLSQWLYYINGWNPKLEKSFSLSDPWFIQYLKLRRRDKIKLKLHQLEELEKREFTEQENKYIELEWLRYLALRYMDIEQFGLASEVWQKAKTKAPGSKHAFFSEQVRFAKFLEKKWSLKQ